MENEEQNNDSFSPWSFRDKEEHKNNELNLIDKITQKVNQTLLNSTSKKKKNYNTIIENLEDDKYYIDVFKKAAEKELEIFESERKQDFSQKNKNILINVDCTLSDLTLGKGTLVTKDDLIVNLPSSF